MLTRSVESPKQAQATSDVKFFGVVISITAIALFVITAFYWAGRDDQRREDKHGRVLEIQRARFECSHALTPIVVAPSGRIMSGWRELAPSSSITLESTGDLSVGGSLILTGTGSSGSPLTVNADAR